MERHEGYGRVSGGGWMTYCNSSSWVRIAKVFYLWLIFVHLFWILVDFSTFFSDCDWFCDEFAFSLGISKNSTFPDITFVSGLFLRVICFFALCLGFCFYFQASRSEPNDGEYYLKCRLLYYIRFAVRKNYNTCTLISEWKLVFA